MVSYEQARADHEYLWGISPANDMTGGYVDQEDLWLLLRTPTKTMARKCYITQIEYWFQVGPDAPYGWQYYIESDPMVAEIAERYGVI